MDVDVILLVEVRVLRHLHPLRHLLNQQVSVQTKSLYHIFSLIRPFFMLRCNGSVSQLTYFLHFFQQSWVFFGWHVVIRPCHFTILRRLLMHKQKLLFLALHLWWLRGSFANCTIHACKNVMVYAGEHLRKILVPFFWNFSKLRHSWNWDDVKILIAMALYIGCYFTCLLGFILNVLKSKILPKTGCKEGT